MPSSGGSFVGVGDLPEVASANAYSSIGVAVHFTEAMTNDTELTDPANYTITGPGTPPTVVSVTVSTATVVLLVLSDALTLGAIDDYTVEVADTVTDLAGNTLEPTADTATFGIIGTPPAAEPFDDPIEHIGLLDPARYYSGWGVGHCAFGASDEPAHMSTSSITHDVAARRRLIAQYNEEDNPLRTLMELLGGRAQTLDDIATTVLEHRGVDTGWGFLLDQVGATVGIVRGGLEDNTYRIRIAGQILANTSNGSPEDVRKILSMLMQGLYDVRLVQAPPGVALLRTAQLVQEDGDAFAKIVQTGIPVGTRCIVQWELPIEMGMSFGFEDDNTVAGFAEFGEDASEAGLWAEGSIGE